MFWSKPTGGPDAVGGLWPVDFPEVVCVNRSGATLTLGEVVQLALTPGEATEIATNDSNSYRPGYSNDTVWNTVIDPVTNIGVGSSIQRGGIFGVCMSTEVLDNAKGSFKFFGIIEDAFVVGAAHQAGDPLTPTITNSLKFPAAISNTIIATYIDIQSTNTARTLRRVFLHQGMFAPHRVPTALS